MPKTRSLTDAAVRRLKPPASGQVDYFDQSFPGLALRISYGGRKSWTYHYRIGCKLKRMTIDTYPAMSVAEAHDAWRAARDQVRAGHDPASKSTIGATDFRSVFEEWLARDQAGNKSKDIVRRKLENDVLPYWGNREIGSITRRDVRDVIDAVVDRGAVTQARRVHAFLHRLFKWAVGRDIIGQNPLADLPKPGQDTKRDRVLSDDELLAVWNAAETVGPLYRDAIRLLILTGARREEIGQLRWAEIDGSTITLAADRTKTSIAHVIPLSATARAIIEALPRISGSRFVFTHDGITPIASWHKTKAKLDGIANIKNWRIHDIRRSVATGLQKLGIPLQVTESVLGHVSGSRAGVVGIYQRHNYADEKRAALEAWGAHVMALVEGRTADRGHEPGRHKETC